MLRCSLTRSLRDRKTLRATVAQTLGGLNSFAFSFETNNRGKSENLKENMLQVIFRRNITMSSIDFPKIILCLKRVYVPRNISPKK